MYRKTLIWAVERYVRGPESIDQGFCSAQKPQSFLKGIWRTSSTCSPQLSTYRNSKGHRSSKTPDECIIDGEPAEVRIPIAFRIQAHS